MTYHFMGIYFKGSKDDKFLPYKEKRHRHNRDKDTEQMDCLFDCVVSDSLSRSFGRVQSGFRRRCLRHRGHDGRMNDRNIISSVCLQ